MALLTECRQAVWTAIEAWPALSVVKRRYKYEDRPGLTPGGNQNLTPTMGDLPALRIYPAGSVSPWVLNQSQEVRYSLEFTLWTREWQVLQAEEIWEETLKALYQGLSGAFRVREWTTMVGSQGQLENNLNATEWKWLVTVSAGFLNPKTAT